MIEKMFIAPELINSNKLFPILYFLIQNNYYRFLGKAKWFIKRRNKKDGN